MKILSNANPSIKNILLHGPVYNAFVNQSRFLTLYYNAIVDVSEYKTRYISRIIIYTKTQYLIKHE